MTIAVAVAAAAAVTGNQDITTADLGGETPKGVVFFYSRSAADGTITSDSGSSFGATDGTNQWAVADVVKHNVDFNAVNQVMGCIGKKNKCLYALDNALGTHSEAQFVSFIAGGVRVNWTTASADGYLVTAIFFSGSDVSFAAGTTTCVDGNSFTTGFQPDIVLFSSADRAMDGSVTSIGRAKTIFGGNAWQSGTRTGAFLNRWAWTINIRRAAWSSGGVSDAGAGSFETSGYSVSAERNATGFVVDMGPIGNLTPTTEWGWVAIEANEGKAGHMSLVASTGDQSVTGLGMTPELVLIFPSQMTADNAPSFTGAEAYAAVTATKISGFATSSEDGPVSNITNEKNTAFTDKIRTLSPGGVENSRSTLVSLHDGGFTLNFSDAPDNTWKWSYIAFGPTSGGGGSTSRNQAWIID